MRLAGREEEIKCVSWSKRKVGRREIAKKILYEKPRDQGRENTETTGLVGGFSRMLRAERGGSRSVNFDSKTLLDQLGGTGKARGVRFCRGGGGGGGGGAGFM